MVSRKRYFCVILISSSLLPACTYTQATVITYPCGVRTSASIHRPESTSSSRPGSPYRRSMTGRSLSRPTPARPLTRQTSFIADSSP